MSADGVHDPLHRLPLLKAHPLQEVANWLIVARVGVKTGAATIERLWQATR